MSKKRWAAFCLLAALCLGLMIPSVLAEDVVYFTAVNNTLLELSAETMPVTHNSMIYVPCSVFNSRSLNTWAYYSREGQTVLVSDGERELYFDMSAGNSHDRDDNIYRYAALYLNETAYVPAYFVADYFGMGYSYLRRDKWHIVRITTGDVLSDEDFLSAASALLETRLNQYLGTQEGQSQPPVPTSSPVPTVPATVTPTPTATPEPGVDRSDVSVRLCFLGLGEQSAAILEALEGKPACFFATAAQLYARPDLARRILGSGSALGFLAGEDPEAEYAEFSQALRDVAMTASFLGAAVTEEGEAPPGPDLRWFPARESLAEPWACAAALEAAQPETGCDLLLEGSFAETEYLLYLLERDHYTLEAVTEVTAGR